MGSDRWAGFLFRLFFVFSFFLTLLQRRVLHLSILIGLFGGKNRGMKSRSVSSSSFFIRRKKPKCWAGHQRIYDESRRSFYDAFSLLLLRFGTRGKEKEIIHPGARTLRQITQHSAHSTHAIYIKCSARALPDGAKRQRLRKEKKEIDRLNQTVVASARGVATTSTGLEAARNNKIKKNPLSFSFFFLFEAFFRVFRVENVLPGIDN